MFLDIKQSILSIFNCFNGKQFVFKVKNVVLTVVLRPGLEFSTKNWVSMEINSHQKNKYFENVDSFSTVPICQYRLTDTNTKFEPANTDEYFLRRNENLIKKYYLQQHLETFYQRKKRSLKIRFTCSAVFIIAFETLSRT